MTNEKLEQVEWSELKKGDLIEYQTASMQFSERGVVASVGELTAKLCGGKNVTQNDWLRRVRGASEPVKKEEPAAAKKEPAKGSVKAKRAAGKKRGPVVKYPYAHKKYQMFYANLEAALANMPADGSFASVYRVAAAKSKVSPSIEGARMYAKSRGWVKPAAEPVKKEEPAAGAEAVTEPRMLNAPVGAEVLKIVNATRAGKTEALKSTDRVSVMTVKIPGRAEWMRERCQVLAGAVHTALTEDNVRTRDDVLEGWIQELHRTFIELRDEAAQAAWSKAE